jgi:integrase
MPRHGENIRQRSDGRWEARVFTGSYTRNGNAKYKYIYGSTFKEVKSKMKDAVQKQDLGVSLTDGNTTVGAWLDKWLVEYKKNEVQPTTYEGYEYNVRHIKAALGRIKLEELKPDHIQGFINEFKKENKLRTLKISHTLLCAALDQAVNNDLLIKNPAKLVTLPKQEKKEAKVLTPEEQTWFIKALEGERLQYFFMFQLATGMRPGEALAIQWSDIDFEEKILTIKGAIRQEKNEITGKHQLVFAPTKTKRTRTVELLDEAVDILSLQKQKQQEERDFVGEGYKDLDLVFSTQLGTMIDRNNLKVVLSRVKTKMKEYAAAEKGVDIDKIEIPDFTGHSLRHTFATRALERDIPLKIVAEWLGHSTIRVTGDIYSHALPAKRRQSMDKLKGILDV